MNPFTYEDRPMNRKPILLAILLRTGAGAVRLVVTFFIVVLIALLPSLFQINRMFISRDQMFQEFTTSVNRYFEAVRYSFSHLMEGKLGTYQLSNGDMREISWQDLSRYISISSTYYVSAIVLSLILGLALALLVMVLRRKKRGVFEIFSFLLISIPDFLLALLLQIAVVQLYKHTGLKLFKIATAGSGTAYFLPILTLSIFPLVYIFRTAKHSFERILEEPYVQTAYSKGLSKWLVLLHHLLPNGLITVLQNMPTILMLTLSNLVIVEYLYSSFGLTGFIMKYGYTSTDVILLSVLSFWFMVEIILTINQWILSRLQKGNQEVRI
ncbi:membrane hypothetical protein [[Clostridium] ultunense Esp]|nr:membrane hypothetical protein [[Clostridium] ultunense Esp]